MVIVQYMAERVPKEVLHLLLYTALPAVAQHYFERYLDVAYEDKKTRLKKKAVCHDMIQ